MFLKIKNAHYLAIGQVRRQRITSALLPTKDKKAYIISNYMCNKRDKNKLKRELMIIVLAQGNSRWENNLL